MHDRKTFFHIFSAPKKHFYSAARQFPATEKAPAADDTASRSFSFLTFPDIHFSL
jgi:hypothetical protein